MNHLLRESSLDRLRMRRRRRLSRIVCLCWNSSTLISSSSFTTSPLQSTEMLPRFVGHLKLCVIFINSATPRVSRGGRLAGDTGNLISGNFKTSSRCLLRWSELWNGSQQSHRGEAFKIKFNFHIIINLLNGLRWCHKRLHREEVLMPMVSNNCLEALLLGNF